MKTVQPYFVLLSVVTVGCMHSWCPALYAENLPLLKRINQLAQPYLDNNIVVGMTIGVLHDGNAETMGYGHTEKNGTRVPDGDTIYEIGSMSKVLTGVLLADAVVQGRVRLEQPAGELLPSGVKMPGHGTRAITLQDLSTHVSGLPRLPDNMKFKNPENPYADYTVQELNTFLNTYQLTHPPGEQSEYSNLAVGLLGHLLALQDHSTYENLLRDRITKPLQMSSTTIQLDSKQQSLLASPHLADSQPTRNWDIPTLAGAGAIRSTTSDLLRFAAANLTFPNDQLGQALEMAWMIHQEPLKKGDFATGLGWIVARDGKTRWHNGQTGGYHSILYVNREISAAVVVLANTATGEIDQLGEDIIRMIAGAKVEPRVFEKSITVPPEVLQKYVGRYELAPGAVFTVSVDEGKLMVGLTGQPTFQVFPRSETEWYYKVVKATLTFEVDKKGACNSLMLFQGGIKQKATRIP